MTPPSPSAFSDSATLTSPTSEDGGLARPTVEDTAIPLFSQAKVSLNALSAVFDGLHGKTMQVAVPNGGVGDMKGVTDLQRDIERQHLCHNEGIAEIQSIIDELLEKQVLGQLKEQIEKDISLQIDEIVQAQVAACLQAHIPKDLQKEVEENKQELERARLALHNSPSRARESRRMNGKLRSDKPEEPLDTLLMSNGAVSPHFPKDLRALFNLDEETCTALSSDYEFPYISDTREKNLNRIMQFCGVRYQLVKSKAPQL